MSVVGVIGLGYVGLSLEVEFDKHLKSIGFDISVLKVASGQRGVDPSREPVDADLATATHAICTADPARLAESGIIIVAVPTTVENAHFPDFRPLVGANTSAGRHMKKCAILVYESSAHSGATENACIPVPESESGLKWKQAFIASYSSKCVNPGDKEYTLTKILKIVSGETPETLDKVAKLHETIIIAGVHSSSSIKTAEAAKVIENIQCDLNISLMNELSVNFDKLGIDLTEVLAAAGNRWDFLEFTPGLVDGHCRGVPLYCLIDKAEMLGYGPHVILAGRRNNDSIGKLNTEQTIEYMIAGGSYATGAKANVLGHTLKENCGDLRNSKFIDSINELLTYGVDGFVTNLQAGLVKSVHEYGVPLCLRPTCHAPTRLRPPRRTSKWLRAVLKSSPKNSSKAVSSLMPKPPLTARPSKPLATSSGDWKSAYPRASHRLQ